MTKRRIVLAGGSGQIGAILRRALLDDGDELVVLSRRPRPDLESAHVRVAVWDGKNLTGDWPRALDGADAVINLAGRSVNCRYNRTNRAEILDSRIDSTRALGAAISGASEPPPIWLQSSTATIYAHTFGEANDENGTTGGDEPDAPSSWRFSIDVARRWEAACEEADTPATRKVLLRSAMTMSPDPDGVFDVMLGLVRRGLGGTCGSGKQFVSWIHGDDFVRAIRFLLGRDPGGDVDPDAIARGAALTGPVNLAAPLPLPNREFQRVLRDAWGARLGLPASTWMLELGAIWMRTETELILKSRRVVPGRLLDAGFRFTFPDWPTAAADLVARWRNARDRDARRSTA